MVNLFCIVLYFYMNTGNKSIQNNLFFEVLRAPITSHKRCTRKKLAVKDFLRKCDQTTVFCGLTLTEEIVNEKLKVLCCEDLCD